ncbi:MAG: leucyl/phenylalanyl-tRNA--protein transferase [Phycisphaerales bacterium]
MLRLTPRLIVAAYAQGAFPMAGGRADERIEWYSPDPRAILPLDGFHCPRSLARLMRRGEHEIRHDTAFGRVIDECAAPRDSQAQTWINAEIRRAFVELHELGLAHSIEVWRNGRLIGGLYGLALGGAFFGESMFHPPRKQRGLRPATCGLHKPAYPASRGTQAASPRPRKLGDGDGDGGDAQWTGVDVSKIALAATVEHLRRCGFQLFDVQFQSEHLRRLGVVEISRDAYLTKLDEALRCDIGWDRPTMAGAEL